MLYNIVVVDKTLKYLETIQYQLEFLITCFWRHFPAISLFKRKCNEFTIIICKLQVAAGCKRFMLSGKVTLWKVSDMCKIVFKILDLYPCISCTIHEFLIHSIYSAIHQKAILFLRALNICVKLQNVDFTSRIVFGWSFWTLFGQNWKIVE